MVGKTISSYKPTVHDAVRKRQSQRRNKLLAQAKCCSSCALRSPREKDDPREEQATGGER